MNTTDLQVNSHINPHINPQVASMLRIAQQHPEQIAIHTRDGTTNYAEFALMVQHMAAFMRPILAEMPTMQRSVVIALPQCAEAYACMFATLLAGGFYVPLNLASPAQKLHHIVQQVQPAIVCSSQQHAPLLQGCITKPYVFMDVYAPIEPTAIEPTVIALASNMAEAQQIPPHHLAYVMFTSGSTGTPKGVMISQQALACYVEWVHCSFQPTLQDRWSQHPNIAFDVSVTDIYGALCSGATLYPLAQADERLMPARFIQKHAITLWNSVPSVLNLMRQANQLDATHLHTLRICCMLGEPLYPQQVESMYHASATVLVINSYGPTEATVACSAIALPQHCWQAYAQHTVSLGTPLPQMQFILDDGELLLAGAQLAEGYWQDPEKTHAAFIDYTHPDGTTTRAYRTGDIVEQLDGQYFFCMRKDRQVKIHGHRIELEEITNALQQCGHPNAAVIAHDDAVYAFIDTQAEHATLVRQLADYLEPYAIPRYIITRTPLLRNSNDKIDAKAMLEEHLSNTA